MRNDSLRAHNCRAHEPAVSTEQHDDGDTPSENANTQKTHPRHSADARTRDRSPHTTRPVESSARESPNGSDRTHAHPADEGVELLEADDIILADGGTTWTDLTAFQRDTLETIATLEATDETSYGLAIKRHLKADYGEVNHGRLYPNLDDLIERGLLEKTQLDRRTNEYRLTDAGRALLKNRARDLADTCGLTVQQPATDGGEH